MVTSNIDLKPMIFGKTSLSAQVPFTGKKRSVSTFPKGFRERGFTLGML